MAARRISKAVIPAAGRGTRLLPATRSQPKEMLPLGRKPCIQYVVEELVAAGITDILIVTGKQKRAIEDHFDYDENTDAAPSNALEEVNASYPGSEPARILYVRQNRPRGLAQAISLAEAFVEGESFVVALGDAVIQSPERGSLSARLIRVHQETGSAATVAVQQVSPERVSTYGIVEPAGPTDNQAFRVADLVEKPDPCNAPSNWAIASRYAFTPEVFQAIRQIKPGIGGELQATDAMRLLTRQGHAVYAVPLLSDETRHDVGNFQAYFAAFVELALQDEQVGPDLKRALRERLSNGGI